MNIFIYIICSSSSWSSPPASCLPILPRLSHCRTLFHGTHRPSPWETYFVAYNSFYISNQSSLIIFRWFMPINVGITFLVGGILGWLVVKLLNPKPQLHGLIIATCASGNINFAKSITKEILTKSNVNEWYIYIGNMGNLMLILVPAICDEEGSPFGNRSVCRSIGLSYASFSMAVSQNQTYIIIISAQSFVMIIVTFFFGRRGSHAARGFLYLDIQLPTCEKLCYAVQSSWSRRLGQVSQQGNRLWSPDSSPEAATKPRPWNPSERKGVYGDIHQRLAPSDSWGTLCATHYWCRK